MKKKCIIGSGIVVCSLIVFYIAGCVFYKDRFLKGTYINNILCENMTVKEAEQKICSHAKQYRLLLKFKDNKEELIKGDEIDISCLPGDTVKKLRVKQTPLLWFLGFFGDKTYFKSQMKVEFNRDKLKDKIQSFDVLKQENMTPSTDAFLTFENNKFIIKDEKIGTVIELDPLLHMISESIINGDTTWDAVEHDIYQKPKITKTDTNLNHQKDVWNQCAAVTVQYIFGDKTETLTGMTVKDWMTYDENGNYVENHEVLRNHIKNYVITLSEKYNTVGRERTIISTATGEPVKVIGGSYGFIIDINGESEQLIQDIITHANTTREPVYARKAASYEEHDYGNTYVEIDLTAQHLWYYKDGSMLMDTDLVSGTYYDYDRRTPSGTYYLYYKQKDTVLRPAPNPDGTYDYESPVDYWMPFNGGIGLHDANWRWRFGGNIYLYNGSHGCINLPVSFVGGFFNNIEAGCPIICFYR